jgi:ADP-ribose pyrophosphatase
MNLEHSRIVWQGKWRLRVDSFRLADGQRYERGFIDHPGAVVVVPLLPGDDGDGAHGPQVLMLRQYRPALERTILELPAGTREPVSRGWSAPSASCARRRAIAPRRSSPWARSGPRRG